MKQHLLLVALLLTLGVSGAGIVDALFGVTVEARAQTSAPDYKTAPPAEELDARARDYVVRRRVMALILIGGTFAGGMIASIARRRERARARARQQDDADAPPEHREDSP